ncbi:MAG: hypothetical protein ACJ798_07920 [Phenylobacterium sp.]
MANRNDNWGFDQREPGRYGRPEGGYRGRPDERRAFDEDDERGRADRERYRARFDRDRADYGRRPDPTGQEYGIEAGGRRSQWSQDEDRRGTERYGLPADYAYRPPQGHEYDPDYVSWRDEQMRNHDRDYEDWRRAQHRQYDEDYRRFRDERRTSFGQSFQDWRSRQTMTGGVRDTTVAPGVSYAGDRSTHSGGYTGGYSSGTGPRPSGMLDPSLNMSADPAMSQTGAGGERSSAATDGSTSGQAAQGAEFGKEPPQVQSTADGATRGDKAERKDQPKT